MLPENLGSKDLGHERHTKAPEGALIGGIAGAVIGGVLGWLMNTGVIPLPVEYARVIISGGLVMAILAGVGALGVIGGLLGALAGATQPEYETKRYNGRVRYRGALLSVHCDDSDWCTQAKGTLRETGARGIAAMRESDGDFGVTDHPRLRPAHNAFYTRKTYLEKTDPVVPPDEVQTEVVTRRVRDEDRRAVRSEE